MRTLTALLVFCLVMAPGVRAQEASDAPADELRVTRAVLATGVEDREPVGVAEAFPATVGTVYFYTVFEGDFGEAEVEHVWLRDGEEVARVPLRVRGPRWRTWSSKRIPADWAGEWAVQVVDSTGAVLGSEMFTVGTTTAAGGSSRR